MESRKIVIFTVIVVGVLATASVASAQITLGLGPNSWSFLNREWAIAPPGGPPGFLPPGPGGILPLVPGMELRGSFVVDAANPQTTPAAVYPPKAIPQVGGVFEGLLLDPASPLFFSGAPFLWFYSRPGGALLEVYSDLGPGAGDPGTLWDNNTGASGAAISTYAATDPAWRAATGVTDGTLEFSGLFSPLTPAETPAGGGIPTGPTVLAAFVNLTPGIGAPGAILLNSYVDVAANGYQGQDALIDTGVFGLGRDIRLNSFSYGTDGVGTPGAPADGPKIINTAGPLAGAIGASAISNDPVLFTVVPEPSTWLMGLLGLVGCGGFRLLRRRAN